MTSPAVIAQMQTTSFIANHNHNVMVSSKVMETPEHRHESRKQIFIDQQISAITDPELRERVINETNQYLDMCDEAKRIIEGVGMVE